MTDRQDEFGRTLRARLLEETNDMQIDIPTAVQRFERELTRFSRRRRVAVAVAGIAAAAAAAVGVVLWNGQTDTRDAPAVPDNDQTQTQQTLPFFLDLRTGDQTPLAEQLAADTTNVYGFSPDGEKVAYNTCGAPVCLPDDRFFVAGINGTDPVQLHLPDGLKTGNVLWSPDGTKVLYQADETGGDLGNLYLHDIAADRTTRLTDFDRTGVDWFSLSYDFSPDGSSVIFHLPRSSGTPTRWDIWSVPVTGGEPTLVLRNAAHPVYLADGERIAFVEPNSTAFDGEAISILNPDGSRRTLAETVAGPVSVTMSPDRTRILYASDAGPHLVDVTSGETSPVDGDGAGWVDDDTLFVVPRP